MTKRRRTLIASLPLLALYVLHNDFWAWWDGRLVFGLPIGLTYHIALTLGAVVALAVLVRFGWPVDLMHESEAGAPAATSSNERAK